MTRDERRDDPNVGYAIVIPDTVTDRDGAIGPNIDKICGLGPPDSYRPYRIAQRDQGDGRGYRDGYVYDAAYGVVGAWCPLCGEGQLAERYETTPAVCIGQGPSALLVCDRCNSRFRPGPGPGTAGNELLLLRGTAWI